MPEVLCPFARQRLLHPESEQRAVIAPIATAAHTAVTSANGQQLGDYFDREDVVVDSHFYVDFNGDLWQYLPVNRKANAEFTGNDHVVSYETWDGEDPSQPWDTAQVATIARLLAWLNLEWGISLIPATSPTGPGVAYHSRFPSWNVDSHDCPGPVRTRQLFDEALPAARPQTTPNQNEEPMQHVAPCLWLPTNTDGTEPYLLVNPGNTSQDFVVASVNGAPFAPPFKDGTNANWYQDFTFLGLWWRRVLNTTGPVQGVLVHPDHVSVACTGGGVYRVAG